MKSNLLAFQNVLDSTHLARQMQAASSNTQSSIPLGARMQDQFKQHLLPLSKDSSAVAGRAFTEQTLSELGQFQKCTQMRLLQTRVAFTELVEKSMDEGYLQDVERAVKQTRSTVIDMLKVELPQSMRNMLNAVQVLLQEQQNTAASLAVSSDVGGMWQEEMRFYMKPGGIFECRCVGLCTTVNPDFLDRGQDTPLVTTNITKEVRKAFFHAAFGGADVLLVDGVAGTGKTETCKDICCMLGRTAVVINASSSQLPGSMQEWMALARPGNVIIIDEANRAPVAILQAAISAAGKAGVPLCLTHNSQRAEGALTDIVGGFSAYVRTEVPDYSIILSSMLACEGVQEADDLGDRMSSLFKHLGASCTKQTYYDWGLRKMKSVTGTVGKSARAASAPVTSTDEWQMVTAALQAVCAFSLAPIDQPTFAQGVLEHFGADAFVPVTVPADFWNAAATKISRTVAVRHASVCLPVFESDKAFVMAVAEEEATKSGASITYLRGNMEEFSEFDLIGGYANGQWKDGVFTRMLREVGSQEQPGWLVVFCDNVKDASEQWESLHTLTDDNRCLRLESGEVIHLRPQDRILFAVPNMDGASPATVSRLGVINIEASRCHRL